MKKNIAKWCGVKFPFSMILVKFKFFAFETYRGGKKDRYLSESVKAATNTFHNRAISYLKTNLMTFTICNFSHGFFSMQEYIL